MDEHQGMSERDVERLLSGGARENGDRSGDIALLLTELESTYVEESPPGVEDAHVTAMLEEWARVEFAPGVLSPATDRRPSAPITRKRLVVVAATALLLLPVAVGGLAVAGVTLPGVLRAPFEAVGIELPNQEATEWDGAVDGDPGDHDARQHRAGKDTAEKGERGRKDAGRLAAHQRGRGRDPHAAAKASSRPRGSNQGATAPREAPTGGQNPPSPSSPSPSPHSGPPTSPPGNSGDNPFRGPPGITGIGPPGQTGAAPPDRGR